MPYIFIVYVLAIQGHNYTVALCPHFRWSWVSLYAIKIYKNIGTIEIYLFHKINTQLCCGMFVLCVKMYLLLLV